MFGRREYFMLHMENECCLTFYRGIVLFMGVLVSDVATCNQRATGMVHTAVDLQ
jgi:hypothetical protein